MPQITLKEPWHIKSRRFPWRPEKAFRPESREELVKIVKRAEANKKGVRAVGTGCSFSAATLGDDYIVFTDKLNQQLGFYVKDIPLESTLPITNNAKQKYSGLIYVEAGIKLNTLYQQIVTHNLWLKPLHNAVALPTLGGASLQSLAGATSTGTHGSSIARKPLADWIRAVHLIGAGGKEFWIERSQPNNITSEQELRHSFINSENLEVIYDDDVFFASIVSVGRFGIIYGLVYELVPEYWLLQDTFTKSWKDIRADLKKKTVIDFFHDYGFFSDIGKTDDMMIYFSLGYQRSEEKKCYITRRTPVSVGANRNPRPGLDRCRLNLGRFLHLWQVKIIDDLEKGDTSTLLNRPQGERAEFNNWAFDQGISETSYIDDYYRILIDESFGFMDKLAGDSAEYAFDATKKSYIDFVDFVLRKVSNPQMVGWLSIRFTPKSDALLGWQRFTWNAHVEIVAVKDDHIESYRTINQHALSLGGAPHWGQFHVLTQKDVKRIYGKNLIKWKKALKKVSQFGSPATFSNGFTRRVGLELVSHNTIHWFSTFETM